MSRASQKGFKSIPTIDSQGAIKHIAVPANGTLAAIHAHRKAKLDKENKKAFRAFKQQMKAAKKGIPLEQRAKVNWSEVQSHPLATDQTDQVN